VLEEDGSGKIVAEETFGPEGPLARSSGGRVLLYTSDGQGNVSQQIDAGSGNVVASYLFDGYGMRKVASNDPTAPQDPYSGYGGLAGYYTDWETGLSLLGFRYYDVASGRFLTRDPIGFVGGINLYEYVGNSPIGLVDPAGTQFRRDRSKCLELYNKLAELVDKIRNHYDRIASDLCRPKPKNSRKKKDPGENDLDHIKETGQMIQDYEQELQKYRTYGCTDITGPPPQIPPAPPDVNNALQEWCKQHARECLVYLQPRPVPPIEDGEREFSPIAGGVIVAGGLVLGCILVPGCLEVVGGGLVLAGVAAAL